MKLSNSKRQLAEIIRASGNKWVQEYVVAAQEGSGRIFVYNVDGLQGWNNNLKVWGASSGRRYTYIASGEPIAQCHRTKLTRDEYMAYLAEFENPAPVNIAITDSLPVIVADDVTNPTLESLITEWNESKHLVGRTRHQLIQMEQAERDAHAAVEARLLDVGWVSVQLEQFKAPTIVAELRDGDIVEITGSSNQYWEKMKGIESVIRFDDDGDCIARSTKYCDDKWCIYGNTSWKFIRRP